MKTVLWLIGEKKVVFKLNWLEYFFLRRAMLKKEVFRQPRLTGQKYSAVYIDEASRIDNWAPWITRRKK